ncbi:hypothetical protein MUK42_07813 [Musa troglodytarum]|uniref:DUF1639 family protein n=1 Tax=Musa troglodytarum TaxID=320322 RepID=A0A9E7EDG5_9LILI|nr:hypothetical protein MUK42_07813 [Musa troglodytarum]URD75219.1 hypothetical protein MUK42_07813 [Musa troglodytarum]
MAFSAEATTMPSETATAALSAGRGSLLHKFSFPIFKTWGKQRILRCMSVDGKGEAVGGGSGGARPPQVDGDDDEGIEEVREKLLVHVREAADRMKLVVPPLPPSPRVVKTVTEADRQAEEDADAEPEPSSSPASRPWKLRTRRRGSRAPSGFEPQTSASPDAAAEKRPVRLRSGSMERRERPKFSITLTREEIDEDIYAVTGHRARRRPRKRHRVVQKQLDLLFPGSWLSEITLDTYKVPD